MTSRMQKSVWALKSGWAFQMWTVEMAVKPFHMNALAPSLGSVELSFGSLFWAECEETWKKKREWAFYSYTAKLVPTGHWASLARIIRSCTAYDFCDYYKVYLTRSHLLA